MRYIGIFIASVALAATIVPVILFFGGTLSHESMKIAMMVATLVWFTVTPMFMWKEKEQ